MTVINTRSHTPIRTVQNKDFAPRFKVASRGCWVNTISAEGNVVSVAAPKPFPTGYSNLADNG